MQNPRSQQESILSGPSLATVKGQYSTLKYDISLAMALDTTTIIMHNRGVSGDPSLVVSLSAGAHM